MKKIAHLSDLHFNEIDEQISRSVKRAVIAADADLLVVSGDLTQRARPAEFRAFQHFISDFPIPRLVVPGNHDIPLYNVVERFLDPFRRFRSFVQEDLMPFYEDDEVYVLGVNSVRPYTISGGRLSSSQLQVIERRFDSVHPAKVRILVCHHPAQARSKWDFEKVRGLENVNTRIDLVLSGHGHHAESEVLSMERMTRSGLNASTLLVRAGTAFSTRHRGEPNSFNLITIQNREVDVQVVRWDVASPGLKVANRMHYGQDRGRWFHA